MEPAFTDLDKPFDSTPCYAMPCLAKCSGTLQRRAQDTTVKLKTELCLARVRSCAVITGWKIENEIRNRRPSFKLCRNLARHCSAKTQLGSVNIPLLVLGLGSREGFQSLTDKITNTVVRRTPLLHGSRSN
ncbi:hypothetical protein NXS19_005214 [Fusarium pseudograminearum]|nr:hypothetical protein NXS19_005214 [Fusarium pseudograminearum]